MRSSARVVPLLLVLLACGGSGDAASDLSADSAAAAAAAAPESTGPKACDLATREELQEIVGGELGEARVTNDYAGSSQCQWDRPGSPEGVSIALHQNGNLENYRAMPGSVAVTGLGDDAVWNEELNQLAVRQGAAVFSIGMFFNEKRRAWAERIGAIAVAKLTAAR